MLSWGSGGLRGGKLHYPTADPYYDKLGQGHGRMKSYRREQRDENNVTEITQSVKHLTHIQTRTDNRTIPTCVLEGERSIYYNDKH